MSWRKRFSAFTRWRRPFASSSHSALGMTRGMVSKGMSRSVHLVVMPAFHHCPLFGEDKATAMPGALRGGRLAVLHAGNHPRRTRNGRYASGWGLTGGLGSSRCWLVVARRYSEGGTPTWFRKKRVKLLCAEKPSSAATSAILPRPEERREIAVSTHSMSR